MKTTVYVLKLIKGKYYVGKTDDITTRYQQHIDGGGSAWTRKYRPIHIEEIIRDADQFDEDKYVKMYMSKYGINNVRGGSYVTEKLDDTQLDLLSKELRNAIDCCTRCGRPSHFIKDCYAKTDVNGSPLHDQPRCHKCGRLGHYSNTCYAAANIFGDFIW